MAELIQGKHLQAFALLPARPGTCPECAVAHEKHEPHNQQSLFYQYRFYNEHGVWPTWGDAIAHCDKALRGLWKSELLKKGVKESEFELSKAG